MKKPRPEYEALVPRIASGELTRKQAADIASEQTGLSPGSFLLWLNHSGRNKELVNTRRNAGETSVRALANTDPDKAKAYADAIKAVTEDHMNGELAAKKFGVSYQYMMRKIKEAKEAKNREANLDVFRYDVALDDLRNSTMTVDEAAEKHNVDPKVLARKDREAFHKALEKFRTRRTFGNEDDDKTYGLDGYDQLVSRDPDDEPTLNDDIKLLQAVMRDPKRVKKVAKLVRAAEA